MTMLLEETFVDDFDVEAILDEISWDWDSAQKSNSEFENGTGYTCGTGRTCGTNMGCQASISPSSCGNTGGRNAMCVPCLP